MREGKRTYWAACDTEEIAPKIWERIEEFYTAAPQDDLFTRQQKSWNYHYGNSEYGSSSYVLTGGETNELQQLVNNIIGPATNMIVGLLTKQRFNATVTVDGSTADALIRAKKYRELVEALMAQEREDLSIYTCVTHLAKHLKVLGEAFAWAEWDDHAGRILTFDPEGNPLFEGVARYHALTPLDVVRPVDARDNNYPWVAVRTFVNKWDLAARLRKEIEETAAELESPEDSEALIAAADEIYEYVTGTYADNYGLPMTTYSGYYGVGLEPGVGYYSSEDDFIPLFRFFHRCTPAMPRGREVWLIGREMVLKDSDLSSFNGALPVRRVSEEDISGRWGGFTSTFHGCALQQIHNDITSVMASNFRVAGLTNVSVQRGSGMSVRQVEFGFNIIETDPGTEPPQVVIPNVLPDQHFKYADTTKNDILTAIGTNQVSMGTPPYSDMTAEATMLLDEKTKEFNTVAQAALTGAALFLVKQTLYLHQRHNVKLRVPVSVNGITAMETIDPAELGDINDLHVELLSPVAGSAAGKLALKQGLVQSMGTPGGAEMYASFLETGNLRPFLEGLSEKVIMTQYIKDMLRQGATPPSFPSDDHANAIKAAREVMFEPKVREDEELVQVIAAYIQENERLQGMKNQQQGGPGGAPGAPPGAGQPPQGQSGPGGMPNNTLQAAMGALAPPGGQQPPQGA